MSRLTAALPTASRSPNITGNPVWLATALPKGKWTLPVIRKRDRRWVTSAASSASPCSAERSGANTGTMARLSIRTRLILLSGALLLFLLASNFYLNRKLAENADGMDRAAALLGMIEEANGAQIAFGEVRYWMTDLAVSLLAHPNATPPRRGGQWKARSTDWRSTGRGRWPAFAPNWRPMRAPRAARSTSTSTTIASSATRSWPRRADTASRSTDCWRRSSPS